MQPNRKFDCLMTKMPNTLAVATLEYLHNCFNVHQVSRGIYSMGIVDVTIHTVAQFPLEVSLKVSCLYEIEW